MLFLILFERMILPGSPVIFEFSPRDWQNYETQNDLRIALTDHSRSTDDFLLKLDFS